MPEDPPDDVYRDHVGIHPQKQAEHAYAGLAILSGRMTPGELRAVAALADRHGTGEVRTTNMQNLLVLNVRRRAGRRARG